MGRQERQALAYIVLGLSPTPWGGAAARLLYQRAMPASSLPQPARRNESATRAGFIRWRDRVQGGDVIYKPELPESLPAAQPVNPTGAGRRRHPT